MFSTTGNAKIHSIKCCVLFDRLDGTIRHIHQVITMAGAVETPDDVIEERVRKMAGDFGIDLADVDLLHVDAQDIQPGAKHTVDLKKRRLVAQNHRKQ